MNYNLTDKSDRLRFIRYANMLLKKQRNNVRLIDESNRTLNQNSYVHVLCRILASETGVTEYYAKNVYLKEMACPDIFVSVTKDRITGKMVRLVRSTTDLSIQEMRKVITRLREWALETFDGKLILPEANISDDGIVSFKSKEEEEGFSRAEIEASKNEFYT